jgi:dihydrofolate reductase
MIAGCRDPGTGFDVLLQRCPTGAPEPDKERAMGKVTADMNVSLDGFIAGPGARPGNPLGDTGARVHDWMKDTSSWRDRAGVAGGEPNADSEVVEAWFRSYGAVVMGRNMFDTGEVPWGDNPPFRAPVFVVTHRAREVLPREGGTSFTFVTDGIEKALALAQAAAGDKNVDVAGGADVLQQFLRARLLDELQLHFAPIFLGEGIRLFDQTPKDVELEPTGVIESPRVTHVRYRVLK